MLDLAARCLDMTTTHAPGSEAPAFRTVSPGVELCALRRHADRGLTFMIRMAPGAYAPLHDHPGGEETYLIAGALRIGDRLLVPGDYYYAPPGEIHEGYAAEHGAVFFVVAPGGLVPIARETAAAPAPAGPR
jgi:quercetin dioxygenase-like cupin family protein